MNLELTPYLDQCVSTWNVKGIRRSKDSLNRALLLTPYCPKLSLELAQVEQALFLCMTDSSTKH